MNKFQTGDVIIATLESIFEKKMHVVEQKKKTTICLYLLDGNPITVELPNIWLSVPPNPDDSLLPHMAFSQR